MSEVIPTQSAKVYRSTKLADAYLYLAAERPFEDLPETLRQRFGQGVFVMDLVINAQLKMARMDPVKLLEALQRDGYALQLPPPKAAITLHERLIE